MHDGEPEPELAGEEVGAGQNDEHRDGGECSAARRSNLPHRRAGADRASNPRGLGVSRTTVVGKIGYE